MNPNYVHTITLYQKQQDGSYKSTVLKNCFYKAHTAMTQDGTNASQANTYTVRIPASKVKGRLSVSLKSDFIVYGECRDKVRDESGYRAAEILARYKPDAFKVTAFSDNTSHLMDKHYKLEG